MSLTGAAEPRLGNKIAKFIANRVWLILIASVLGQLGAWHWFLDLFAHFGWPYLFAALVFLSAAIYAKIVRLIALSAACLLWNFALIALMRSELPDVIAVAEVFEAFGERLKWELGATNSIHALLPDSGWQGIGVLVKNGRMHNASADLVDITKLEFPTARLRWPGGELLVVHPIPPISSDAAASRDHYFSALAQYAARQLHTQTLVVTGDFNASVWSAPYRQMQIDGELVDSTVGFWPTPTWRGPDTFFAPLSIPINQLLLRGLGSVSARIWSKPDSGHSVLITTLKLAPR